MGHDAALSFIASKRNYLNLNVADDVASRIDEAEYAGQRHHRSIDGDSLEFLGWKEMVCEYAPEIRITPNTTPTGVARQAVRLGYSFRDIPSPPDRTANEWECLFYECGYEGSLMISWESERNSYAQQPWSL